MASPVLIVGGLAVGGGILYLLWKKSQEQVDACVQGCKVAAPVIQGAAAAEGVPTTSSSDETACVVACKAGSWLTNAIATWQINGQDYGRYSAERDRRQKINDTANGAVAIPLDHRVLYAGRNLEHEDGTGIAGTGGHPEEPLQGNVLRYANGCEPFYGAPGWSKCGAGTLDMYTSAIDAAAGRTFGMSDARLFNYPTWARLSDTPSGGGRSGFVAKGLIDKTAFLTGAAHDPALSGPHILEQIGTGKNVPQPWTPFWNVLGKKVTCAPGQAPAAVVNGLAGQTDHRTGVDVSICVPIGSQPWQSGAAPIAPTTYGHTMLCGAPGQPPCGGDSDVTQTVLTGSCVPGYSWTGLAWERTKAGSHDVCRGSTGGPSVSTSGPISHTIDLGALAL